MIIAQTSRQRREAINTVNAPPSRRLYRSRDSRLVAGVASGIARHVDTSEIAVRLGFVALYCLRPCLGLLLYATFWIVLPREQPTGRGTPHRNGGLVARFTAVNMRLVGGAILILAGVSGGGTMVELVLLGVFAVAALMLWWIISWLHVLHERRIREQQRVQVIATIHDEVLQTLALIQRNAGDADTVRRLTRVQERRLSDRL